MRTTIDFEIIVELNGNMRSRVSGAEVRGKIKLGRLKEMVEHFDTIVANDYQTTNAAMIELGKKCMTVSFLQKFK